MENCDSHSLIVSKEETIGKHAESAGAIVYVLDSAKLKVQIGSLSYFTVEVVNTEEENIIVQAMCAICNQHPSFCIVIKPLLDTIVFPQRF